MSNELERLALGVEDIMPYGTETIFLSTRIKSHQEGRQHMTMQSVITGHYTCSSPRCPLRSHSLVCIKNHLFIVVIGPIINKELELIFRSDRSDRTCVYS